MRIITDLFHFLLFVVCLFLIFLLTIVNYFYVRFKSKDKGKGYFRSTAVSLDKWGNVEFRTLWNETLIIEGGYKFGHGSETISGVLGKNQRSGMLSKKGKALAWVLDKCEKQHCFKSIDDLVGWDFV